MRPGCAAQSSAEAVRAAQVERGREGERDGERDGGACSRVGGPGLRDNLRTLAPQHLVLTALLGFLSGFLQVFLIC